MARVPANRIAPARIAPLYRFLQKPSVRRRWTQYTPAMEGGDEIAPVLQLDVASGLSARGKILQDRPAIRPNPALRAPGGGKRLLHVIDVRTQAPR